MHRNNMYIINVQFKNILNHIPKKMNQGKFLHPLKSEGSPSFIKDNFSETNKI